MTEQIGPEIKTIIWDLDGTLLDSLGVFDEVLQDVLPGHDLPAPTLAVLAKNFHGSLEESIRNALGGISDERLAPIVDDFLRVQNTHYEVIDHHLCPDAVDLAQRAHEAGMKQIVVTNRAHEGRLNASPRYIVENSALRGIIDEVICGDDSEYRKPKREVLGDRLDSGLIVPTETLVIGDQFVDAQLAYNLGARAILVCRSEDPVAHLDQLEGSWQNHVAVVRSLEDVRI